MFLMSRAEFKNYLSNTKKPFMANFYKLQRKKNNFLIDEGDNPIGGKWSFDEENRKKFQKNLIFQRTLNSKKLNIQNILKKLLKKNLKVMLVLLIILDLHYWEEVLEKV